MPTIIDSLYVEFGVKQNRLDDEFKKLDSNLKNTSRESDKAQDTLSRMSLEGSKSINLISESALRLVAAFGGVAAAVHGIRDSILSSAALERFSENIGIGVDSIMALSNVARIAGGSAEGLQGTLNMLARAQAEIQLTGNSSIVPYLAALGVQMGDTEQMLLHLADRFSHMDKTRAFYFGQMMGIDPGTMNLLLKGREEIERMIVKQNEAGLITKAQAEQTERLRARTEDLVISFESIGRQLVFGALPALEWLVRKLKGLSDWAITNKDFILDFLRVLAVGLGTVALTAAPINVLLVAITGLAAGITLLWQDYQVWQRGGKTFVDWDSWKPGIDAATKSIQFLHGVISDVIAAIRILRYDIFNLELNNPISPLIRRFGRLLGLTPGEQLNKKTDPDAPPTESWWETFKHHGITGIFNRMSGVPRGIRNNNPGNLNFANQPGAVKESGPSGRFAVFGSMEEGISALVRQIRKYEARGLDTIRKIFRVYAPESENNTPAYIDAIANKLGISPDTKLSLGDANQTMALVRAIIGYENGKGGRLVSDEQIIAGYGLASGRQPASATYGLSSTISAMTHPVTQSRGSVIVNVGGITVHTAATDSDGIARDIGGKVDYLFTAKANYGIA